MAEGRRPTAAEQEVLARYSGWGALKDIFNQRKEDWEELRERFRDLVTADEYYSALNSTKNAFYTPPYLIRAMWDAVVRMGFGGGAVLEPAVGVGHFFGLMPPDVGHVARFGTELDRLSGTLAQQLYPNSRVAITPFEKARLPEQFFRLIISNVPFDELRIQDERYPGDVRRVHDYFFARSADLLAPGGVIAFVTSSGTMDKPSVAARAWLNERLRFIGAVRLHNKALPGTAVTADIVFLQKPEPGVAVEAGPAWLRTVRTKAPSAENPDELVAVNVNEYFVAHPEMILGRMRQGSMYHAESEATTVVVDPTEGVVTEDALREALARLPEGIISDTAIRLEDIPAELTEPPVPDDVPRGAHVLRTNRINRHDPGSGNLIDVQDQLVSDYGKPAVPKMRWFLDLRDKLLRLMQLERDPDAEAEQVEAARKALNDAYDRGHKRWGPISKPSNLKILANDVFTTGLVRALENYNRKTRTAEKTGILRKRVYDPRRVVTEVDDIGSGILVSLDRVNRLDWDLIARLTSRSVPDLQREALENDLVFEDPAGGWALKDEYLSGNVRRKLRHAEEAARNDPARWQRNVEALQSVMPADVGPSKIGITLGATWVPANYYTQFARELFAPDAENLARNIDIRYSRESRSFIGEFPEERLDSRPEVNSTWGTVDMPAYTILMRTLNLKAVEVRDTEYYTDNKGNQRTRSVRNEDKSAAAEAKQEEMRQEWTRWAWKDPTRADVLVRIFNEKLNSNVPRQYDGSYLSFPGMSVIWRERLHARKYQPRLVARWLQTPTSMLVNAVTGSGKTVSILAAATESIRLRMSSKNAIAVQLSTYQQYLQTAREVYPAGNFLFLDADEMKGDKLQINLGRISVGDYDTVILPHTTVEKIPMSKEYLAEFRDWIRDRIHDAIQRQAPQRGDRDVVRRLRNALQKLEDMLQNMIDDQQRKRVSLTWEQLGVDMLFVDEAQKYKNLWYMTQLDHVKGLGNPDGSKRALDMWLKIRYANQKTGGKGAMLATGTPIANTIAELYTVMRYVAPGILEEMQIEGADEWISMFAEVSAEVEPTIEGGYAAVMRMRRLRNLPQLITTANTHFMESVTHEEVAGHVELPLIEENPQGRREPTTITIEGSDEIDWVMHRVALLGRWIRRNFRDALEMRLNFLVLTDIIRKLAIDPRLINERFTAGGKLKAIVDQVVDTYHDSTEAKDRTDPHSGETYQSPDRGVQAVFFVIGTPKADPQPNATGSRFNPVNEFVDMLVEAGIPREEIGLVWDYNRNNIADGLLEDARRGRKRVLIGSPEKLGIGTNFHDRLRALHIVSPPWRPDEIQQPYGRIIRPGNGFKEVRIVHYVTKGTGDELMYALLRTKMEFIASFLKGKVEGGDVEIDNRESFQLQEINALASKNPALLEFAEKSRDLRRLRGGEKAFRDSRAKNEGDLAYARNRLRTLERDLPKYQKLAAAVEPAADVVVRGQTFGASAKRLDIAKALWKAAHDLLAETRPGTTQTLGSIGNVAVIGEREASRFGDERPLAVRVLFAGQRGEFSELNVGRTLTVNESAQQHWNSVRAMLSDPATVVSNLQAGIEELRSRIRSLERGLREAAAEFPEAAQLQQVQEEVNALQGQIAQGGGQISDAEVANLRVAATPRYFDPVEGGLEAWLQQRREAAQDMITDEGRALMEEHAERQVRAGAMPPPLAPPAVRERALELFNPMRPAIEHDRTWLGETTPEQREWLRKRIQAGRPGFGMGAMVNVPPDARTAAQRAYDAIRGRFYDLPPGKLRRAVRGIGRGLFGRLWHNTAKDAMHLRGFEDIRGRTREARLDVEPVVGDVVKLGERLNAEGGWDADRIRELEDRRRKSERGEGPPVDPLELTPEEQMWNRVGEAADTGDWSQLSREEEQILRRYQALLARVNDRFWTMPEQWRDAVSKFGLLNVQDIMRSLQERGIVYLRRLYKPRRNLTYQAPPVLSKEKRMVGPRIGDSMFRFRRSDYDLWTVTLVNGQKLQFLDEEEAYEFAERHREENRERFGTNVNNVVRVLDPLEKPIVEALQPERNLGMRMLRTLVQWSTNVEVLRVFGHLADTVGLTEGELPGDFDPDSNDYNLARLPDVPTLGPLAGKWVPEAVAYNVMEMDTTRVGLLGGIHDLYLYLWKFSKVVANPATWARQLYGLNFSWVLDGIHPVTHAKWYSAAAREMRERGRYWRYLVQTNDITTGFAEQMQDDLLDRLNSGARFVEAVQESARAFLRGTDKVGRGYDWIDQISKLASFMHKVDKLGYTWVDARDSLWMYPNYDRIGTWANRIRKSAWGAPFWAFNGSAVQWNIRGLRQHPGRLAMMWLAPGALTLLSILLLGLDDEERELADKGRTYWQPLLPWKDTHGRAQTLDCQWIFPLANDFRVDTGPGGLGFTFLFGQPITKWALETAGAHDLFSGRRLYTPDDTPREKLQKFVAHTAATLTPLPNIATRGVPRIISESLRRQDESELLRTLLKEVLGLNIRAPYVRRRDALAILRRHFEAADVNAVADLLEVWNEHYAVWDRPIRSGDIRQSMKARARAREK